MLDSIKEQLRLLLIEKKVDFEQYKQQIQSLPISKRREKGVCWYPIQVIRSGFTYGDRAFVVIERGTDTDQPHKFRSGMPVNVFSEEQNEIAGVINFVTKKRMKIVFNGSQVPRWLDKGKVGIDLLFDERTYLEMEKALKKVLEAKGNRLAELRDIILGQRAPQFKKDVHAIEIPNLNRSQNKAIQQVLAAYEIAIIHGPPGTGKTTTLVQAVKLLSQFENHILVTAPSNAAVDLLAERLQAVGVPVTRIGNISRVDESLIDLTLDGKLSQHPEAKTIKKVKIQAAEAQRQGQKLKQKRGKTEFWKYFKEASELKSWAHQLEERLIDQILANSKVIACTLVNTVHPVLDKLKFQTVVIDEAGQALEPATWIPITRASKVILAGDPFQLPPTIKSREAQKAGFDRTILEKMIERLTEVSLLNVQYRMNHKIMGFSNQQFYDKQLLADESVNDWLLDIADNAPITFIDTAGCSFDEKVNAKSKSRYNPDEFNILREHFYQLMQAFSVEDFPSIGIISPYREQALYIQEQFEEDAQLSLYLEYLSIDTIDAFQGQERDIIYISLVRSNEKMEIGFLSDYRRMNVAMTRAKKKLIVIGDSATIANDKFYNAFIDYVSEEGLYQSAWDYMY